MDFEPTFRTDVALVGDAMERRLVIVDETGNLHAAGSRWLSFLHDVGRSPNTIKGYGTRVAWYLSWTALTADWRSIGLHHLAMWKNYVANSLAQKSNGVEVVRSEKTVGLWMTPLRSFYEWADAEGLLRSDVAARMTQLKYFAAGTPGGGEHGTTRRVLVRELQPARRSTSNEQPEWIDDPEARERLEILDMKPRDRFLVDLLYFTGIRVGEALSLFTRDMHFGGGSADLGCRLHYPHFHVVLDNPVENGARAKGCARTLPVGDHLVERYIDYVLERQRTLAGNDKSPHVFVNLYTTGMAQGRAMSDTGARRKIAWLSKKIDYPISGPHLLRHTFATRLIRGIDCEPQPEDVVGHILGHRNSASTKVYTHDQESAKKKALMSLAPRSVDLVGEPS